MHKLVGFIVAFATLAGAGVALAGQPATNSSGDFIDLSAKVSPPIAGTQSAPQGVGISFDYFAGNRVNGNSTGVANFTTVRLANGFKWNGSLFRGCKINANGLSRCSNATRIGAGTAEVELPGSGGAAPTFIPARVIAYNGKPFKGNAPTLILIGFVNGKPTAEIDFNVKPERTGPYGLALISILFPGPQTIIITKFSVTLPDQTVTRSIHGHLIRVHLLDAPTTCHKSWPFELTNTFTNLPPLTATDDQPCTTR